MSLFICPKCGYRTKKKDICPKCKSPVKKACPYCGRMIEYCTCTGDIPQTKGRAKIT